MRQKRLGASGLRVSELCLGTATFRETRSWGAETAVAQAILGRLADSGPQPWLSSAASPRSLPCFPHELIASSYLRKLALGDPALLAMPSCRRA